MPPSARQHKSLQFRGKDHEYRPIHRVIFQQSRFHWHHEYFIITASTDTMIFIQSSFRWHYFSPTSLPAILWFFQSFRLLFEQGSFSLFQIPSMQEFSASIDPFLFLAYAKNFHQTNIYLRKAFFSSILWPTSVYTNILFINPISNLSNNSLHQHIDFRIIGPPAFHLLYDKGFTEKGSPRNG